MRISRGLGAVAVGAALAFVTSLALPAAGQPTSTSVPTTTVFGGGGAGGTGGMGTTVPGSQQSATTSPLGAGTGVTSTTTAPGVSQTTAVTPDSGGVVGAPDRGAVLVLVRRLTWREAAAAVRGRSETIAAGLVSTLPKDASLAARVLSLAAGRQVDARALAGGSDQAAIDRMRAANPDAHFGGLPQVRVVAASGLETASLIGLGPTGGPPPAAPLEVTGPPLPAAGELLVVAVPDGAGLRRVLEQFQAASSLAGSAGGAPTVDAPSTPSRFVIVGLESPKGHAQVAPFVALGGAPGVVTSDSTRRRGVIAFQDVRPTLAGSAAGTDGSTIRALGAVDPLGSVGRLDRQVASLVAARIWAIPLAGVMGTFALVASLLALLLRRRSGRGREVFRRLARALLLLSLALPSGYLVASAVAPLAWLQWLLLGVGASLVLALAAWLIGRLPRRRARPEPASEAPATAGAALGSAAAEGGAMPAAAEAGATTPAVAGAAPAVAEAGVGVAPSWAAPALLGALVATLIVVDLLLGGVVLSRPLLGNSAFDGERFYGLGNGYFAHAIGGVFLVVAFRQLSALTAAALLVGLALVDGLPILGADVGGALTATLTAAAAWLLLRRRRWSRLRVLLVVAAAVVLAVAIAFGLSVATGPATHGSRIARELLGSDPSAALRTTRHQLSRNFALLAGNFWAWWGPILAIFAAVASVRPPSLLAGVPAQVRRVVGVGAIGSLLLIVLNDTGVTAAAGSGLALVATLAWYGLEPSPAQPDSNALKPAAEPAPAAERALAATAAPDPEPAQVGSTPEPVPDEPDKTDDLWKPGVVPASGSAIGQDPSTSPNGDQDGSVQRERGVRRDGPGQ